MAERGVGGTIAKTTSDRSTVRINVNGTRYAIGKYNHSHLYGKNPYCTFAAVIIHLCHSWTLLGKLSPFGKLSLLTVYLPPSPAYSVTVAKVTVAW